MNVEDYPSFYRAADAEAKAAQRLYVWLTSATLVLAVAAAALAVVGALTKNVAVWYALVAALVISTALRWINRAQHADQRWFKARAVAESLKSGTWRYMMRVDPYDQGDPDATFLARTRELCAMLPLRALALLSVSAQEITLAMRELRIRDLAARRAAYLSERIENQITWYSDHAAEAARASAAVSIVATAAEIGAVLAAIILVADPGGANLVGVGASLAAATTAWGQLRRYDEIAPSYALAAGELRLTRGAIAAAGDDAFAIQAAAAEESISREHTMWAAKRGAT